MCPQLGYGVADGTESAVIKEQMKVAHVLRKYVPREWGGTESVLFRLLRGLRACGTEGVVFCPCAEGELGRDPLAEDGTPVKRFRYFVPIWGVSHEQREQLVRLGGNLMSFDLGRQLWGEPSIDLIHTHALNRLGAMAWWVAKRRGIPLVLTIHGGVYDLPDAVRSSLTAPLKGGFEWGRVFGWMLQSRRLLDNVDAVITCNPREAELVRQKHPGQRVMVQPHGVETARFAVDHRESARAAYPQLADRRVILVVGRVDPAKNQDWVVRQFQEVLRRHPGCVLVLAGACTNPVYGGELARLIETLGLGKDVQLTGGIDPGSPVLAGLMQLSEVLVVPSLSETFGLVILEAWAAGTAVLSSKTSGACSLVEHGTNGWLFDLDEPAGFHRSLDVILTDPEHRRAVVELGNRTARDEYDVLVLARRVEDLYRSLIEKKGGRKL